jgi:hypothetical protein
MVDLSGDRKARPVVQFRLSVKPRKGLSQVLWNNSYPRHSGAVSVRTTRLAMAE